jgi:serine/threonine-protein kinase
VLADRARETIQHVGYTNLPFESDGFDWNDPYLAHVAAIDASAGRWERLRTGQPAAIRFWFRASPVGFAPANPASPVTAYDDPPFTAPGMVGVWLDTKGRLLRLDAVPRSYMPAAKDSVEYPATNWAALFEAAGLPFEAFHPVPPEWSPLAFADERRAWQGVYPDAPDVPIRVEAAAFAGRPVSFRIVEPWMTPQDTHESARSLASTLMSIAEIVLRILVLIGAALLAARNMRRGRSDPRGAFRLATYFLAIWMLCWILGRHPFAGATSIAVFFVYLSWGIYRSVVVWVAYVAIEPYLRRLWPRTMISWARALEGRWRDPLVGRDILLGAVSAEVVWLALLSPFLIARWSGMPMPAGSLGHDGSGIYSLGRFLPSLSPMLLLHAGVLLNAGFLLIVLVVLLRLITRKTWISVLACVPLIIAFNLNGEADRLVFLVFGVLWLLLLFRFGVLCLMTALGLMGLQIPIPATLSTSAWYAGPSWVFLALFVAVAVYGFVVSLGGQLAFGKVLAEE